MSTFFIFIFLAAIPAFFLGMITRRGKLAKIFAGMMVASFIGIALTATPVEQKEQEIIAEVKEEGEVETILEDGGASLRTAAKVVKVVDGDTVTVEIDGVRETIRIIGINTPETVDPRKSVECFGQEASARAHELLDNQTAVLEADETQGERDKYDRLLRYVFLSNGSDFGKQMIFEGYAYEYTYATAYTYQQEYKASQSEAENAERGLWAADACSDAGEDSSTQQEVTAEQTPATTASCSCSANIYSCNDFSTHAQAQEMYTCCINQVNYDVHRLDGDNDGQVCETLP